MTSPAATVIVPFIFARRSSYHFWELLSIPLGSPSFPSSAISHQRIFIALRHLRRVPSHLPPKNLQVAICDRSPASSLDTDLRSLCGLVRSHDSTASGRVCCSLHSPANCSLPYCFSFFSGASRNRNPLVSLRPKR
ncbi:hypothetical protein B296_00044950 [Ensete ventricosum]|uniref:Uncharacterized protein n=1 Tax=Ensete ventricosum TaxID=4639 RepID=A0A426WYK2_ENSVE|nr:hypothetical protein B296_00044950 [Ensete ventricosum]